MARHARDRRGIEDILRREFHAPFGRVELVCKTDTIGDLGTELKPSEIEIDAESYFAEIVCQIHDHRFLPIATDIETCSTSGNDVWAVVAFPCSRPFEVQRQIDGNGKDIDFRTIHTRCAYDRVTGFGLIGDGAIRELQSRAETEVEVVTQAQVGNEADMETGQQRTDSRMVYLRLSRERIGDWLFTIRDEETGEVQTKLETEMEEFVIHVGSVLTGLCLRFRSNEQGAKSKDQYVCYFSRH